MQTQTEYSLFLEQVNKLTERRQKVTATYLSVNAAIVGVISFVLKDVQMVGWGKHLSALMLLIAGVIICDLWRRLIKQYSTLLGWWYEQLRTIEENMSESSKLLTKEYQELYTDKHRKIPIGLTRYETRLTWIFTGIYIIFGVVILVSFGFL